MPWVRVEDCNGCGTCVGECPVCAISLLDEKASIDMNECIYCGVCHRVCPQDAVRHDSERVPQQVSSNLEWIKDLGTHYRTIEQQDGFKKRIKRHFNNEKLILEKTLEEIDSLEL